MSKNFSQTNYLELISIVSTVFISIILKPFKKINKNAIGKRTMTQKQSQSLEPPYLSLYALLFSVSIPPVISKTRDTGK